MRCDHRLQYAPLQHRRGAPAIVHLQPGLGSRRRSQPLPQDCVWQGERCAGSPARTPYLSSPWSPRGMPTSSWKCSPAAWSTPPPQTASWCCLAGSLEEAPSGMPASPTAVETPADNIVPSPVKSPEKQNDPGQPVRKPFKCEQCDFSSDTKHGLSVHNGKAHRPEPASERLLSICNRCDEFYYPSDSNYQSNPIHQIYCDNCMLLM